MFFGGKKREKHRIKRSYLNDEVYLDSRLSKGEAERRAWKALSGLTAGEYFGTRQR